MKSTIQIGNTAVITFCVTTEMQPHFSGAFIHPVCSTWDIAHQFEIAARLTLEPHLCDGEQGIGSYLSIDHSSPAPVGEDVTVKACIVELDESKVVCSLTAKIGSRICATGKQIQRVLPLTTISALIEKASTH